MSMLSLFEPRDEGARSRPWTVSELTGRIKATLEADFGDMHVAGEVSGLKRHHSGHVYFKLKDEGATIDAVLWKSTAARLVFDLADGLAVRARGDVSVYPPRGQYQLVVRALEPEGIGALELAFRQMFEKLKREGLFDRPRLPLPRFPRRIVIVTSPTGAAVRDFLQVTGRRWRAAEVLVAPARVQGQGAAAEIAEAIARANLVAGADLIVVARGGGSLEDLWAFNEEPVARAIAASRLPVVSAVGHEVDVTIADLVADFRALTPSEAGERCVPDAAEVRAEVESLGLRLSRALQAEAQHSRGRVDRLADRLARAGADRLRSARARVDSLAERGDCAVKATLERRHHALARIAAQLDALSPLAVLSRGYSLTLKEDGTTVVRAAADCRPGDRIRTRLAAGTVVSRVETVS